MIPAWNTSAVLPAIRPGQPGCSFDRSPYRVPMAQVVDRFATSPERIAILRGLLGYRSLLCERGIAAGFQWLDGSFMENKELLQGNPPNDVDVVTFFSLPAGETQRTYLQKNPDLFDVDQIKNEYKVDPYPFVLGQPMEQNRIKRIAYWYSMWSHRRNGFWKGFLEVELSTQSDAVAASQLTQIEQGGPRP